MGCEVEDNWVLRGEAWGQKLVARLCIGLETKIDHEGVFLIFVFGGGEDSRLCS